MFWKFFKKVTPPKTQYAANSAGWAPVVKPSGEVIVACLNSEQCSILTFTNEETNLLTRLQETSRFRAPLNTHPCKKRNCQMLLTTVLSCHDIIMWPKKIPEMCGQACINLTGRCFGKRALEEKASRSHQLWYLPWFCLGFPDVQCISVFRFLLVRIPCPYKLANVSAVCHPCLEKYMKLFFGPTGKN